MTKQRKYILSFKHNKESSMKCTCNVFNIGTVSKRLSYILRFLNADFNKIRRNVCRSIAHNCPTVSALIVAALKLDALASRNQYNSFDSYLGMLYRRASSPKLPLLLYVWIWFSPTYALYIPLYEWKENNCEFFIFWIQNQMKCWL